MGRPCRDRVFATDRDMEAARRLSTTIAVALPCELIPQDFEPAVSRRGPTGSQTDFGSDKAKAKGLVRLKAHNAGKSQRYACRREGSRGIRSDFRWRNDIETRP